MAFAQLTWRESLRNVEVTLGANASKLYAMGLRHSIHRSTLADANESRNRRILSDVAALLIRRARKLCSDTDLVGLDLKNTVYGLDATTIDLCLSLFDWALFRKAKRRSEVATTFGPAGRNPSIYPHQRRRDAQGQRTRLHASRGWRLLRDGPWLLGLRSALCDAWRAWIFRHAGQSKYERTATSLRTAIQNNWHHLRPDGAAQRLLCHATLPGELATDSIQGPGDRQDIDLSDQQLCLASTDNFSTLQKPLAGRIVLQMDQTAPANQEVNEQQRERGKDENLVRRVDLRADCHRQKGTSN